MPGKCGIYNIGTSAPLRFSVVQGGAKSRVVTISLSPQGGAYIKALKSEGSLCLLGVGVLSSADFFSS